MLLLFLFVFGLSVTVNAQVVTMRINSENPKVTRSEHTTFKCDRIRYALSWRQLTDRAKTKLIGALFRGLASRYCARTCFDQGRSSRCVALCPIQTEVECEFKLKHRPPYQLRTSWSHPDLHVMPVCISSMFNLIDSFPRRKLS